MWKDSVEDRR
uniref:Uncharacterized protein n=1 Tax=Anguilla anguilla TaxID=7936 RepID=A0A0E9ULE0_ANGAN